MSANTISGNSNSCLWMNIRIPTGFRRISSTRLPAGTATSWSWATTRRASIRGEARISRISSVSQPPSQTRVYKIETNYRSVPEILDVANAAICANGINFARNWPRSHLAAAQAGARRRFDDSQQAAFVAQRVLELHEEGVELNEMAVLYRAHYHSMEFQLEFTRRGIPFLLPAACDSSSRRTSRMCPRS